MPQFWPLLLTALLSVSCATSSLVTDRKPSEVITPKSGEPLERSYRAALDDKAAVSGFQALLKGTDAMEARVDLAKVASTSLDIQYYIWHKDRTGRSLIAHILDAAERGVRVRLLLDDIHSGDERAFLRAIGRHPNVEVRIFNPAYADADGLSRMERALDWVVNFNRLNKRMHNKVYIADARFAIIGGRNIGDEYFDLKGDRNFRDVDVLTMGGTALELGRAFDLYWNSKFAYPLVNTTVKGEALALEVWTRIRTDEKVETGTGSDIPYMGETTPEAALARIRKRVDSMVWAPAEVLFDAPDAIADEKAPTLEEGLQSLAEPRSELLIESAYFIPPDPFLKRMEELHKRGVKVKVLTNSMTSNDVLLAHAGYATKRQAILETGSELYEWRNDEDRVKKNQTKGKGFYASRASLHSKAFVVDRRLVFIGSLNIDPRSIHLNTETGVVIHSETMAEEMAQFIEDGMSPETSWQVSCTPPEQACADLLWKGIEKGSPVQFEKEPDAGFFKRGLVTFLGWLPIEDSL